MSRTAASPVSKALLSGCFLCAFIGVTGALYWDERASYPLPLWLALGSGIATGMGIGLQKKTVGLTLIALCLGSLLAFWNVQRSYYHPDPNAIELLDGEYVIANGTVTELPTRNGRKLKLAVKLQELQTDEGPLPVTGKVLVETDPDGPAFGYGDQVKVQGIVEKPQPLDDGFAYDRYLALSDIRAIVRKANVQVLGPGGNLFLRALFSLRKLVESTIQMILPEPHASFLAGLLTGSREGLPEDLTAQVKTVGLTHIMAISGYNITIILTLVGGALLFLPRRLRFLPMAFAVISFTIFVGAGASVVRAAIMGIIGLMALQSGRLSDTRLTIGWTAFFMILWRPASLWDDMGFQLSFLALLGLTECTDLLEPLLKRLPSTLGFRDSLHQTLAAQVIAVPWIVYRFGELSLISPVANILAAPLVPIAMAVGTLAVVAGMVWAPLGLVVSWGVWLVLEALLQIVQWLAKVPGASVNISSMPTVFLVLYYVLLGHLLFFTKKKAEPEKQRLWKE